MPKARGSALSAISAKLLDIPLEERYTSLSRYSFHVSHFARTNNLTKLLTQKTLKRHVLLLATHPPLSS